MPRIWELENWLTTGEAASWLKKSRQGVVWLLENRRLRGANTHLGWLVDPEDVGRYARERGIEIKEEQEQ